MNLCNSLEHIYIYTHIYIHIMILSWYTATYRKSSLQLVLPCSFFRLTDYIGPRWCPGDVAGRKQAAVDSVDATNCHHTMHQTNSSEDQDQKSQKSSSKSWCRVNKVNWLSARYRSPEQLLGARRRRNFNSWDGGMLQKVGGATALKMAYITYIYIQAFKTSKVHQARLSLH